MRPYVPAPPYGKFRTVPLREAQAARTPEPLISSEAAARLREQAAGVEDKRLRESILKALEASEKPGSSKNGKSGL